jgi:hypothetical protein
VKDLIGDVLAALGAVGLAVAGLVAVVVVGLAVFAYTASLGDDGDDLKLPLCKAATVHAQCWAVGSAGTLVVTYGTLTATDPGYDDEPRRISREQALDELNVND